MTEPTQLWGGRFKSGPSEALANLSRAPRSYFRLYREDIAGSRAHASELKRAGVLDESEFSAIRAALEGIEADVGAGREEPIAADEDLHTFLERLLMARLGTLGGKLRAGRSRNDQTANNTRLYLRRMARELSRGVIAIEEALTEQASRHTETVMPGFTHLQPAQPVVLGHHLMAHAQSLLRDLQRFADWDRRFDRSPLGAAALAGSGIARRPDLSAIDLGYSAACENSIDAVAARDHVAEFLFICSLVAVDLSRLAEEICLWSSKQFSWVRLHDSYSTGSSIMPQKKNPDAAELTRGMSGTLIGNIAGFLATMKAMPLAYNRDLAEDKRSLFETIDVLELVLPAFAGMVGTLEFDVDKLREEAPKGFTLATEVADWLVGRNVPFAEAHEITGAVVRYCEERGHDLAGLTAEDLPGIDPRLQPEMLAALALEKALASRNGYGATAPERVCEQIARFETALAECRAFAGGPTGGAAFAGAKNGAAEARRR
ncbi:argininosuccinate lyase [Sinorhizobium meliloti]|uniref:argininosuccinate lyase n=1 Tax=Rhizobium meliloti TaxID=382 RepID=UPI000B498CF7|nr:argininosuccinate lyase [Sinorhizobium meliloti]ASQ14542.1 argininosuccinate lyase [Sinorhizobium meliloti]MDE3815978.1 argininosuccinate lyase [Sinorhizobium meliloti]MDW9377147.1 argininosuccinate lyase [Sinorhizobium meliloti]MDW9444880.1 argininosuccinate lyase [Sinorhizobium meliloti]MDW9451653.1 argininosuccinate lyase [Sinorhizobium meliloti]